MNGRLVVTSGDKRREPLVGTLGVEPQVMMISLHVLLAKGCPIREVVVICTLGTGVGEALAAIEKEFENRFCQDVRLHKAAVKSAGQTVADFQAYEDLRALLRTLYSEVRRARQEAAAVHLRVSGGRKVMGIIGMVVAQLLFAPEDCVWHLVAEGWRPGAERRLHVSLVSSEDRVQLVRIPVLRWSGAGTLVCTVAKLDDPGEVVA